MITLRCRLWLLTISVYDPSAQTGYYTGPLPALILRPKNWKTDARKGGSCGSFRQSSFKTLEVQEMRDRLCQAEAKSKIRDILAICLLHAPDQLYDSEARRQINTLDCMILRQSATTAEAAGR